MILGMKGEEKKLPRQQSFTGLLLECLLRSGYRRH
jgi:hypothetical protein